MLWTPKRPKKKEKMKEWKKQNKWKQVENSNILQPWWVIARTKKYFFIFFCLSSCSVATALLRLQVSRTEGDCWRDDEKQSHKDLQARQKHGSIYTTHAYTHIDTHTPLRAHTHLSCPCLPSAADLKQENGTKYCSFESNVGLLTLSHPLFQENTGSTHLYIFISRIFTCNKNYISKTLKIWIKTLTLCQKKNGNTLGRFQFKASVKFNMF